MIFKKYKTLSFPNSRFALSTLKNEKLHTSESPALQSILGADFHTPKNPKPITNRVNENLEQKLQKHKTTKTQKTKRRLLLKTLRQLKLVGSRSPAGNSAALVDAERQTYSQLYCWEYMHRNIQKDINSYRRRVLL